MLNIPLGDLGAADAEADEILGITHPLDDVMSKALEAENGIAVEFNSRDEAIAMRFRMYRRIKFLRKRGIHSYNHLTIGLKDRSLIMSRLNLGIIKDL